MVGKLRQQVTEYDSVTKPSSTRAPWPIGTLCSTLKSVDPASIPDRARRSAILLAPPASLQARPLKERRGYSHTAHWGSLNPSWAYLHCQEPTRRHHERQKEANMCEYIIPPTYYAYVVL